MLQNAVYLVESSSASSVNFHAVEHDVKAAGSPSAIFNRDLLSIDRELSFGPERHRHASWSMVRGVHSQLTFDHTLVDSNLDPGNGNSSPSPLVCPNALLVEPTCRGSISP